MFSIRLILLMATLFFTQTNTLLAFQDAIQIGQPLPLIVSTPVTGRWYEKYPFQIENFGKTRGHAPANQVTRLAIFIDGLDEARWQWLKEIDNLLVEADREETFVTLFDAKGAQVGGFDALELQARIDELQKLTDAHKIEHLSIGVAANIGQGNKSKAGLNESHNFAVILLRKADGEGKPVVESQILLHSEKAKKDAIKEALLKIAEHLKTANRP